MLMTPRTKCPNLGKIVTSFIIIAQRGRDQLVDFVLMGSDEVSRSPPFGSNWSEVYLTVGSVPLLIINFFHLERVSISAE